MNSVLLWLGIAVALLLSAAFTVPFFIDWSDHKTFFEERAGAMLGRPVAFEGPFDVRLVPFPSLDAENVHIGGPESGEGAERVTIRAALAPLLSGELSISEMVLVRPRAELRIDGGGELRWGDTEGAGALPLSPGDTRIDQIEILGGEIAVRDERTGAQHVAGDLNLTGSATTLEGPLRLEGGATLDGRPYGIRLATGRISPSGTVRVTGGLSPADRPLSFSVDGAISLGGEQVTYEGKVVAERVEVDGDGAMPWRLDAEVAASAEQAVADRLSLRLGPDASAIRLNGAATTEFAGTPRFDAILSARQIDLDRSFGGGPEEPVTPARALERLAGLLDPQVFPVPGRIGLDVSSLVVSGNLVESLAVDLEVDPRRWRVASAEAYLPGQADAGLSGVIDFGPEGPSFDGALRVSGHQAGIFAAWLFGPDARVPGVGAVSGEFEAESNIGLDAQGVRLDGIDLATDAATLTGSLSYAAPSDERRGRLTADIRTDRFELDPDRLRGRTPADAISDVFGALDLDIDFEAGRLVAPTVEMGEVALSLTAGDGEFRLDRLRIGDLGGATLTGQGAANGLHDVPVGRLSGKLEAESLTGLATMLDGLGAEAISNAVSMRAAALAPAELDFSVEARPGADGAGRVTLRIDGTAAGTALSAGATAEGELDDLTGAMIDVVVEADNPDGARLAAQLGVPTREGAAGPGRLSVSANGRPADGMPARIELAGLGMNGSFEGRLRLPGQGIELTGELSGRLADPGAAAERLGLRAPGVSGPLEVSAEVSALDDVWRLSDLVISTGDIRGNGTVVVDLATPQRRLDGRLEVSRFSLPWLFETALGPGTVLASAPQEEVWSSEPFAPMGASAWRGGIEIETPRLELGGGFHAAQAAFELAVSPGRIGLENVAAGFAGGEATGAIGLSLSQSGVTFEGRMDVRGGRLEELAWHAGGRPVASGVLDFGFDLGAEGRSMAGLVAGLSGEGTLRVGDGTIRRINARAFDMIVRAADAGLELTEERVREAFAGHLDSGNLSFEQAEGSMTVAAGVARMRNVRIDTGNLDSFASATVDLTQMALDSEWSLSTDAEEGGRRREVGLVFAGPIADPERQIDVNPLLGYLTVRAFEQDVERLESLQSEILERERLGRELLRLGEERRRREREEAEAATRAEEAEQREAEEAARRAAEEAARQAQEESAAAEEAAREAAAEALREADDTQGALPREDFERMIEDVLRGLPEDDPATAPRGDLPQGDGEQVEPPAQSTGPLDITPPAIAEPAPQPVPMRPRDPSQPVGGDGLF